MFLSKQRGRWAEQADGALVGQVSLAGNPTGVYLTGERRALPVYAPGGYDWVPAQQDAVLVLSCGVEERACVVARESKPAADLLPGEAQLSVHPDGRILLKKDGSIHLNGRVFVNGVLWQAGEAAE